MLFHLLPRYSTKINCKENLNSISSILALLSGPPTQKVALVVKNPPANAGEVRDTGSVPGLAGSFGGGHDN